MKCLGLRKLPFLALFTLTACAPSVPPGAKADWILTGGQVVTVDRGFTMAQALAVRDGQIIAVGTASEVDAFRGAL
jgi:hypothetical protein